MHRSKPYNLTLEPATTLGELHAQIEELTRIPPHLQKLLYKGKHSTSADLSLQDAGLHDGMKVTLLGNAPEAIEGLLEAEKQQKKKEDILKARAAKAPVKVRAILIVRQPTIETLARCDLQRLRNCLQIIVSTVLNPCNIFLSQPKRQVFSGSLLLTQPLCI